MKYRAEIDGLRSIAVLPVILFHAGFTAFSGGYVGVDVFFVISGYLITKIIVQELDENNFSILSFYERRARRILPALFLVITACIPIAWLSMSPAQLKDFGQSIVAVVLFTSNILFWYEEGYFSGASELKPMLHTWSLAVEEQFYLVFPLLMRYIWKFGRTRSLRIITVFAIASLAFSEYGSRFTPAANFYLAHTRAWELLAGSICAFVTKSSGSPLFNRHFKEKANLLSTLGLSSIVFAICFFDKNTPIPSLLTMIPVGGTALVIIFGNNGTYTASFLSSTPLVSIGLVSYSAYLWHQPLFAFARLFSLTEPSPELMGSLAVLSLALAYCTWQWIEQPVRSRKTPFPPSRSALFLASGICGFLYASIGIATHFANGFPNRSNGEIRFADIENRVSINYGLSSACDGSINELPECATSSSPNVALWGDSVAMHLVQGLIASGPSIKLRQHTKSACSPIVGLSIVGENQTFDWAKDCIAFNDAVLLWIQRNDIDLVVMSSIFGLLDHSFVDREGFRMGKNDHEVIRKKLIDTVSIIRRSGARVIIVSPPPTGKFDTGQCVLRAKFFRLNPEACNFTFEPKDNINIKFLHSIEVNVPVYWLHNDICTGDYCVAITQGKIIFRDRIHLSQEGSEFVGSAANWTSELWKRAR